MSDNENDPADLLDDDPALDGGPVGQLVDDGWVDTEADLVAQEAETGGDQLDPGEPSADGWLAQDKEEVVPAEEAAMHITEAPPMGDRDGYVED